MGDFSQLGPVVDQDSIHNPKATFAGVGSVILQAMASLQYRCRVFWNVWLKQRFDCKEMDISSLFLHLCAGQFILQLKCKDLSSLVL